MKRVFSNGMGLGRMVLSPFFVILSRESFYSQIMYLHAVLPYCRIASIANKAQIGMSPHTNQLKPEIK